MIDTASRSREYGGDFTVINSLLSVFPTIQDLNSVEPEDLGAVIIEIAPSLIQKRYVQRALSAGPSIPAGWAVISEGDKGADQPT